MLPSTMVRDNKRKEGKIQERIWKLWTKGDFVFYDSEKEMTGKKKKDKTIYMVWVEYDLCFNVVKVRGVNENWLQWWKSKCIYVRDFA